MVRAIIEDVERIGTGFAIHRDAEHHLARRQRIPSFANRTNGNLRDWLLRPQKTHGFWIFCDALARIRLPGKLTPACIGYEPDPDAEQTDQQSDMTLLCLLGKSHEKTTLVGP